MLNDYSYELDGEDIENMLKYVKMACLYSI